jgi:hypothetical protein
LHSSLRLHEGARQYHVEHLYLCGKRAVQARGIQHSCRSELGNQNAFLVVVNMVSSTEWRPKMGAQF